MLKLRATLDQRLDEQGREPAGRSATVDHEGSPGVREPVPAALQDALRRDAAEVLATCLDAEVSAYVANHADMSTPGDAPLVVRNGFQPLRVLSTSIGPVALRLPKVRARIPGIRAFRSALGLRYLRRASSLRAGAVECYVHALAVGDWPRLMADLLALPGESLNLPTERLEAAWMRADNGVGLRRKPLLDEGRIEVAAFMLALPAGTVEPGGIAALVTRAGTGPWRLLAAAAGASDTILEAVHDCLMKAELPSQLKQSLINTRFDGAGIRVAALGNKTQ